MNLIVIVHAGLATGTILLFASIGEIFAERSDDGGEAGDTRARVPLSVVDRVDVVEVRTLGRVSVVVRERLNTEGDRVGGGIV